VNTAGDRSRTRLPAVSTTAAGSGAFAAMTVASTVSLVVGEETPAQF
jgi:hypothetical protein